MPNVYYLYARRSGVMVPADVSQMLEDLYGSQFVREENRKRRRMLLGY